MNGLSEVNEFLKVNVIENDAIFLANEEYDKSDLMKFINTIEFIEADKTIEEILIDILLTHISELRDYFNEFSEIQKAIGTLMILKLAEYQEKFIEPIFNKIIDPICKESVLFAINKIYEVYQTNISGNIRITLQNYLMSLQMEEGCPRINWTNNLTKTKKILLDRLMNYDK